MCLWFRRNRKATPPPPPSRPTTPKPPKPWRTVETRTFTLRGVDCFFQVQTKGRKKGRMQLRSGPYCIRNSSRIKSLGAVFTLEMVEQDSPLEPFYPKLSIYWPPPPESSWTIVTEHKLLDDALLQQFLAAHPTHAQ
jgi:hypothetical protein